MNQRILLFICPWCVSVSAQIGATQIAFFIQKIRLFKFFAGQMFSIAEDKCLCKFSQLKWKIGKGKKIEWKCLLLINECKWFEWRMKGIGKGMVKAEGRLKWKETWLSFQLPFILTSDWIISKIIQKRREKKWKNSKNYRRYIYQLMEIIDLRDDNVQT